MGGTKKPTKATKKTKARESAAPKPKRRSRELREDELEKVAGGAAIAVKWSPTAAGPADSTVQKELVVESFSLGTSLLEKNLTAPLYKPRKF
jgi:hypothetical protein